MVLFNYATKEITAKVVYYGPGLCGKTTNLHFIYDSLPSSNKSKMLSLATQTDRTLFFDFLPLDLGKIRGMKTRLQLYTVPGQVYYNSTRQLVLKGSDGVVFVADSHPGAMDGNVESLQNLEENLKRQSIRITEVPLVLQYNKRDLQGAVPVEEMNMALNKMGARSFESVATTGIGVEQTLNGIAQIVLAHLAKKYGLESATPIEKEIHVLNPTIQTEGPGAESVWADDNVLATTVAVPEGVWEETLEEDSADSPSSGQSAGPSPEGYQAAPIMLEPEAQTDHAETDPFASTPGGETARAPLEDEFEQFQSRSRDALKTWEEPQTADSSASEVVSGTGPTTSPEEQDDSPFGDPMSESAPDTQYHPPPAARSSEPLIKEITLPLNLTLDELRQFKKLKVRITIDVNLLQ